MTSTPAATGTESREVSSNRNRQEFTEAVSQLKVTKNAGPRDRVLAVLGLVLAGAGLAVTLLCYTQATGFDDLRDQVQTLILGLFGLGLVVVGAGLYVTSSLTRFLRVWMLRLLFEQRER